MITCSKWSMTMKEIFRLKDSRRTLTMKILATISLRKTFKMN